MRLSAGDLDGLLSLFSDNFGNIFGDNFGDDFGDNFGDNFGDKFSGWPMGFHSLLLSHASRLACFGMSQAALTSLLAS